MRSISARVTAGMSEDFGNCSNYDAKPFAKAIMPHRDYTEVLSFWGRTADDARHLQSHVAAVFRERDDAYKERDVLRKEVAALRAQINCNAENALRLQSELTAMRVERDRAYQEREMLSKNVVALRAQIDANGSSSSCQFHSGDSGTITAGEIRKVMSPVDFPTEGDEVRPVKRGKFGYVP